MNPKIVISKIENISAENILHLYDQLPDAKTNLFLSDIWLKTWYLNISVKNNPLVLGVFHEEKLIGLAIFHLSNIKRRIFFKRRILSLNEIAGGQNDMTIEFNGLFVSNEFKRDAWGSVLVWLYQSGLQWDELQLNFLQESDAKIVDELVAQRGLISLDGHDQAAPFALMPHADPWDAVEKNNISSNRRRQIRKSRSLYEEKYGSFRLHIPADEEQEQEVWRKLGELHTQVWNARGIDGSFANPCWLDFHERVRAFGRESGQLQLVEMLAGEKTIGVLYNLLYEGEVYNIQTGFSYEDDNRLKPGFVCHYEAMKYCHSQGIEKYNFMGGGEDYKSSLSSEVDTQYWRTLRKRPLVIEDLVVNLVRKFKN